MTRQILVCNVTSMLPLDPISFPPPSLGRLQEDQEYK